ncbi:hypothetical protein BMS3Abin01_00665 [bacterium BMS3Abin01]|nr:hypothetical protein BMS3Abin01_00665 [bacterium BMS3Abin01]
MDIQELVENRIAELKARTAPPSSAEAEPDMKPPPGRRRTDAGAGERRPAEPDRPPEPSGEAVMREPAVVPSEIRVDVGDSIDEKLAEVSLRIMEITEKVSIDCNRMEQNLLRSRLEVLQSAEAVLDIAMSLRRQVAGMKRYDLQEPVLSGGSGSSGMDTGLSREHDIPGAGDGRASMKEYGVANLFRRT